MSKIYAFLKDQSGATAIEYGLIAAGISIAIIGVVNMIGSTLNTNLAGHDLDLFNRWHHRPYWDSCALRSCRRQITTAAVMLRGH